MIWEQKTLLNESHSEWTQSDELIWSSRSLFLISLFISAKVSWYKLKLVQGFQNYSLPVVLLKNGPTLYFQEIKFEHQILESFHRFPWKTYILNPTWRDLSYLFSFPSMSSVKDPVKSWLHLLEKNSTRRREHSQRAISFPKSLVLLCPQQLCSTL